MAFIILPLGAQSTTIFAPFVSGLQGEVKSNFVRLSWIDSQDVRGPVYIYRSDSPFEGEGPFQGAGKPVEIPYGVRSYVDEIDTGGPLYYFVAASDEIGKSYDVPIAFSNTIAIQSSADSPPPIVVQVAAPERGTGVPPGISGIDAVSQGERIAITFNRGNVKSAAIYRSIRPIAQRADLLGSVILQTKVSPPYIDYPVPGISYYYAVVSEDDLVNGTAEIIPGQNATKSPVQAFRNGVDMRAIPLPQMSPHAVFSEVSPCPEINQPNSQAALALVNIPSGPRGEELKRPRVFARDLEVFSSGSEECLLSSLVKGSFVAKNWDAARRELTSFLALPRSPEIQARARFYLGQSCYFLRLPREGLFEFLSIQNRYPSETAEWIRSSLEMMQSR